jgi:hypothetical protein
MINQLEAFSGDAVLGKIRIRIYKKAAIAMIEGGDGGPGTPATGGALPGFIWAWSIPLAQICANQPNIDIQVVLNTLANCMAIIGGTAQQSCNSYSSAGSGDYAGPNPPTQGPEQISIGGTQPYGSDSDSYPTSTGQLQIFGQGIDISGANQGTSAQLSQLPVGFWVAQPIAGCTQRVLGLFIED